MKDRPKRDTALRLQLEVLKSETGVFLEANDHNPLAMLRNEVLGVDHLSLHRVSKFLQSAHDHFKGFSLVMTRQVFDILEHEGFRPMMLKDPDNIKEQCSLCFITKSMFSAE